MEDKIWVVDQAVSVISVAFGVQISRLVPGYVSTEVDARLSFDVEAMVKKAKELLALYKEAGVEKSKILIKLPATWEGIVAGTRLKKSGIECNMTLVFNYTQAIACGANQLKLISPFVGRIMDYHKKNSPQMDIQGLHDPGVVSVSAIYHYFKRHGLPTIVMGASFRNPD